ncbi:Histidine decarboxylase [Hypsibius exemplaris]|uniref:Histidine decarboxylase n=1 Tax=Hypsibius exemplaris TaxID=2072580 RepID=A0A1W0XFA0_HYPEX|nr:Histidine decarboxylase [Hypsibius exemplaris]
MNPNLRGGGGGGGGGGPPVHSGGGGNAETIHNMDFAEYRKRGKEMVDYIADYLENIRSRRVFPNVQPGYMRDLVSDSAPQDGEDWDAIFADVERVIMPGVTHWQSPYMHAYFPALNSFPSLLGDMLADAINCLGFTWASSPACTELETIVMDWLGKMIGLPQEFLHSTSNKMSDGGGVIQTTASEATFVALLAARTEAIRRVRQIRPDLDDAEINSRLVGYCSDQAHSSVEKAGLIGLVKLRLVNSDAQMSLRGEAFRSAVEADVADGLIPFFLCATLGTTGACAFDNLMELGPICQEENIWMHLDAAYAGSAFICPEYRSYLQGAEYAQSFAFNPSKWLMVHFDCTAMWVKNSRALHRTFCVDPLYLRHEKSGDAIDYMHWQIPLSRRFRALKLWFVLRSFGVKGLQNHIRHGVALAKKFEEMLRTDLDFEIPAERILGMVVFRLRGENERTEMLLKQLNRSGLIHMVPASLHNRYVIRFTVTSPYTTLEDITRDFNIIRTFSKVLIAEFVKKEAKSRAESKRQGASNGTNGETEEKKEFGVSLLLANSPLSPKFVNGSFAAIFGSSEIAKEFARQLNRHLNLYHMQGRRRPYRKQAEKLMSKNRQYSLDSRIQSICDTIEGYLPDLDEMNSEYTDGSPDELNGEDGCGGAGDMSPSVPLRGRSKSVCVAALDPHELEDPDAAYQHFAKHVLMLHRSPSLNGMRELHSHHSGGKSDSLTGHPMQPLAGGNENHHGHDEIIETKLIVPSGDGRGVVSKRES